MSRTAGTIAAFGLASVLTAVIAWPVVRAPTEQIFGAEIVGRHHDPFTVIRQMAGRSVVGPYLQPATDWTGWLLARVLDPVAAYNLLILLTFPLTAAATYALARYLRVPHVAALVAALLFAFAPLHAAHAAYHPHIAQTQWLPLYFLALFAMIDRPSPWRALALAGASAGLVLANFYAGLTGAVLTPVALVAYWWASPQAPGVRHLWITAGVLAAFAVAGAAAIVLVHPQVVSNPSAYAFPISGVARYSARWWAYFVPPVSHAVWGSTTMGIFERGGITLELVEQQVFVSYAVVALAAGAALAVGRRSGPWRRPVLALWALALAAAVVSIGPLGGACTADSWAPACRLYAVAPMFRSYARFAFVTHLALALAAGAGLTLLARRGRLGQALAACLVALAVFEYWPLPARARDVLPTEAHRWLARQSADQRSLDCTSPRPEDVQVPWLMQGRLTFVGGTVATCRDPNLGARLAALGYTHVLVREPDEAGALPLLEAPQAGLAPAAAFASGRVFAVAAPVPAIVVIEARGFFEYEYGTRGIWRWMGAQGQWRVRNTTGETRQVALMVDLESVHEARRVDVVLDGEPAGSLDVPVEVGSYKLGPWALGPGDHAVVFRPSGQPFRPSDHGFPDDRALTVAFHGDRWVEWSDSFDDRAR